MKKGKISNSLGFKVIISLIAVSVIPLVVYLTLNNIVITQHFSKLENESVTHSAQQAKNIIGEKEQQLGNLVKDYAIRDDVYDKMNEKDNAWYSENVTGWLSKKYGMNLILAVNKENEIIDQYGIKDGDIKDLLRNPTIENVLSGEFDKKPDNYPAGLMEYQGDLYMIAACPVLKNDFKGNPAGILIIGEKVTDEQLAYIRDRFGYNISLIYDDGKIISTNGDRPEIAQYSAMMNKPGKDMPVVDKNVIADQKALSDISGKDIGNLMIMDSRQKFLSTANLTRNYVNIAFLVLIAVAIILSYKLRSVIINPIKHFENQINQMAKDCELKQVEVTGPEEIKSLAQTFNWMIDTMNAHRIENENLKQLSITDSLTGLYNHRYFFEMLHSKIPGAKQLSVLFCDIDHFKMINDSLGHSAGDIVLREIGEKIRSAVGEQGTVFRYGGEEFVVMLENCDKQKSYEIAEKLRLCIVRSEEIQRYYTYFPVTISIGIAGYPDDSTTAQDLLQKVDKAMYYAKQNGRNQCQVYAAHMEKSFTDNSAETVKQEMLLNSVYSLAAAIDAKDSYTEKHSEQVTSYALQLAEKIRLSDRDKAAIRIGGLLHDCGKIGVPDDIIHKPGALTNEEFNTIKNHTLLGSNIIKYIIKTPEIEACIRNHHERWDGSGYPDHLSGKEIPLYARIICIADAYHAMISNRPYRKGLSQETAFQELRKNKGKQFDPELVDEFIQAVQMG